MSLYAKCKADPTDANFVDNFKKLHPEFRENLGFNIVSEKSFFVYVVLTYDIESPFVIRYRDWAQRRRESAKLCNFPKEDDKYHPEVEDIILGMNRKANKIILNYLFLQSDLDFINYQSYQSLFYRQSLAAMETTFDNPGHYDKLKNNIDELSRDIKQLQTAIFQGDETKELRKALYDYVMQMSLDIRPEDIAERKHKGEPIVDEPPYPNGYDVDKMRFIGDE